MSGRGRAPAARVALSAGLALLSLCVLAWAGSAVGVSAVDGGSMSPSLEPGDVIVFERVVREVGEGDIVVFRHPGWPGGVAHRVSRVEPGDLVQTKGDANPVPDRDPVPIGSLVGRVIARVPSGAAAKAVARTMRRWYTSVPIAQQAMTERRPAP